MIKMVAPYLLSNSQWTSWVVMNKHSQQLYCKDLSTVTKVSVSPASWKIGYEFWDVKAMKAYYATHEKKLTIFKMKCHYVCHI